ncbi:MAG: recombination-associated protein RdgC [Paraglaciecola sp.]|uniref:recombination-associated protein RdgC n=1 Tax=Pseudomonadati TaxID=3379134 RepID=UPI00273F6608|nr:recombination-associated protein RdgC [Paraglaciecola sp.]MDP5028892.1 recombination-associated protein RdgC [Paraglaciecola sp.]MDP5039325.1 recombination-associated protein RdgC [Paraglaciecola sp.]MDP5129747.1 recombination-associated protein RdgC [Paraglaciecola sp.]
MWFKNLKLYALTQTLDIAEQDLEDKLAEFSFRPCGSQDLATMGFSSPINSGQTLIHAAAGRIWLTLKKQERILPAAVVNAELAEKVAQIEAETGSPVGKKAQQDMKQEIVHRLLPMAFTKNSFTHGFISTKDNLVVVDASADGKAEAFLAMLRKAIGSLPVVPLARQTVQAQLTAWLQNLDVPKDIVILEEAELKALEEDGAILRCKNQDLGSEEIINHIEGGKVVQKLAVEWDETLSALIQEDLTIKRLKFTDVVREQNDDIPKDQQLARMDANFALMSGEIVRFAARLKEMFDLNNAE